MNASEDPSTRLAVRVDKKLAQLRFALAPVVNTVTKKLAVVFSVDPDDMDPEVPLSQYCIDSLMAMDLGI
ncbi:Highly reducing polyketide synthase azaB [Diaporthe amygdali]|uniref:Highly reducing polyketide synthase azaB n=1 Tax=Phomopsis amygdali TaxID=1214568 RepID=UPI0022FE7F79|nr:Highly reducing polyketide synthase azaB [Diaporthe amygdali]KAJ0121428.1 Highly reducing polyketide synthase azaB [Diaporthe amygdali]